MDTVSTDLGKIYCKWNDDTEDYDRIRVTSIDENSDGTKTYGFTDILSDDDYTYYENEEYYNTIKKDWILLKSEGIISVTNIVALRGQPRDIRDILLIFYPNIKGQYPDIHSPMALARQGINDLFAEMAGIEKAGMSVCLNTLPDGFALIDFMANDAVLESKLCHVYKTDKAIDIAMLLGNEETDEILRELYDHRIMYLKNTVLDYEEPEGLTKCVDGYCNDLYRFIKECGFMNDVRSVMGIMDIDFELEENVPLSEDDLLFVSALYGGIHINKAVPMKFDYDIDLSSVKMNYLLLMDCNEELFIVGYTESPNEIDAGSIYNLTEERTKSIQERLKSVIKAYDKSIEIESTDLLSDFLGENSIKN